MSMLKIYSINTDINDSQVNIDKLKEELDNTTGINNFEGLTIKGDVLTIFGDSFLNESTVDTTILNHEYESIDDYKNIKYIEIDVRTSELISMGYTFASKQFSLSQNAQTNILAIFTTKDNPAMTYPISYNTLNDDDVYSIPDSATLEGMYLTALGTKKAHLDSGTALKELVRATQTKSEIDAIIDQR